jgi:glycosyltransferase involved in cell wall biosynthesis
LDRRALIMISVTNDLNFDQRMRRHAEILVNAGFRIRLLGRKRKKSIALDHEPFEQHRLNCWFEKGMLFYIEYNLRLLFYLLCHKADIYVAVDLDTLLPNTITSLFHQSKLVYDAHEYFTEVPELIDRPQVKAIWNYVAKICLPYTAQRYTVGEALAKELTAVYGLPFKVIMNVPKYHETILKSDGAEKLIVYQGALNKGRGLEAIIKAMHKLDGKLLLIGEGDLSESLRALVQTENLSHKIEFTGWVKPSDLPAYTQKAWLGYNLLEAESKSYYFSLANKFFDYIHAGIPQLCPPFPEYASIQEKFEVSFLCDAKVQEIVKAVNLLNTDEELYKKLHNNCRMAAKAYNLQLESEKLISIFQSF